MQETTFFFEAQLSTNSCQSFLSNVVSCSSFHALPILFIYVSDYTMRFEVYLYIFSALWVLMKGHSCNANSKCFLNLCPVQW